MKYATLIMAGVQASKSSDDQKVNQIVAGILQGAINAIGMQDILQCVTDVEGVLGVTSQIVTDFEKRTIKDAVNGLKLTGKLLITIGDAMNGCAKVQADFDKLDAMGEVFKNPKTFAMHIG